MEIGFVIDRERLISPERWFGSVPVNGLLGDSATMGCCNCSRKTGSAGVLGVATISGTPDASRSVPWSVDAHQTSRIPMMYLDWLQMFKRVCSFRGESGRGYYPTTKIKNSARSAVGKFF
tara:strand:+ start:20005 stop:20364 length:360 start_codon:yes stop_codon:yes gene_type:complete